MQTMPGSPSPSHYMASMLGRCCWKIVTATTASAMGGPPIIRTTGKMPSRPCCVSCSRQGFPCVIRPTVAPPRVPPCSRATSAETNLYAGRKYSRRGVVFVAVPAHGFLNLVFPIVECHFAARAAFVGIAEAVTDGPVVGSLGQSCLAQALNEAGAVLRPPERRRYHAQQCDCPVAQRNGLAAAEQCVRLCIKAERIKDVGCGHLPIQRQFRDA